MITSSNITTPFCKEAVKNGMRKETNSFVWEIENFDVVRKSEELIKLQRFDFTAGVSLDFKSDWSFQLLLPKHKKDEGEEQLRVECVLFLTNAPTCMKNVFASWHLKIKCTEDGAMKDLDFTIEVEEYNMAKGWGEQMFPQNQKLEELPLNDGSLILELTMHLYAPHLTFKLMKTCKDAVSIEERFRPKFFEKLQNDLAKLMVPTCPLEGSTVTKIVARDGVEFNAAPNVLSLRSPVFKAMFESRMIETSTGIVRITDISSKTMTILLAFLYTGILLPDWRHPDVIPELVYAAAKYQLPDLLQFLDEVVGNVCTKDNAGKLMNLAKKLSLEKAENDLWEFVKSNIRNLNEISAFMKVGATDFTSTF